MQTTGAETAGTKETHTLLQMPRDDFDSDKHEPKRLVKKKKKRQTRPFRLTVFPALLRRFGFLCKPRIEPRCSFGVVTGGEAEVWMEGGGGKVQTEVRERLTKKKPTNTCVSAGVQGFLR